MNDRLGRALEIFREALDLDAGERAMFLERECAGNVQLREEVDALLAADEVDEDGFSEESLIGRREGWDRFLKKEVDAWKGIKSRDPETIGSYEIVRRIGEGGMGIVYEAKQDVPRRSVALKVLSAGASSAQTLKRFQREAQVLGRLVHPGIAQIFEAGTFDGAQGLQPFFAMELVDGQNLKDWALCAGRIREEILRAFCGICEAVHHAHERGVVHRDLKPENVIITREGQPKVLDFGVARASRGEGHRTTIRTVEGQLLGTVAYMSPEQASGGREEVDGRSDVYSLGVMLFELLTNRLPHEAADLPITEAVHALRSQDPLRLRDVEPTLRGDLDTIVSRALEREPRRRYSSAQALADEVHRHLLHEPIKARPTTALYTLRKLARRHRGLTAGAVLSVLTLIGGLQIGRLLKGSERNQALERQPVVNFPVQAPDLVDDAYRLTLKEASLSIGSVRFTRARELLREEVPEEQRGWEWYHLMQSTKPVAWTVALSDLRPDYKWGTPAVFSEDGSRIFAFLDIRTIGVWAADSGEELNRFPAPAGVMPNSLNQTKGRLSLLGSNQLTLLSAEDGAVLLQQPIPKGARSHAWAASGDRVAVDFDLGDKQRFELQCGPPESLVRVAQGEGILSKLYWTQGDTVLYGLRSRYGGYNKLAYAWSTEDWSPGGFRIPSRGTAEILSGIVSEDGNRLLVVDSSAVPRFWNLDPTQRVGRKLSAGMNLLGHTHGTINETATSSNGDRMATVAVTHRLLTWDTKTAKPSNELEVEWYARLAVSPDERWLAVRDRARLRLMPFGPTEPDILRHDAAVEEVRFTAGGSNLVTQDSAGSLRLFDAIDLEPLAVLPGEELLEKAHSRLEADEFLDPIGSRVINLSSGDIRDAKTGARVGSLVGLGASKAVGRVRGALSPSGAVLAIARRSASVYELDRGVRIATILHAGTDVHAVAWSPDGSRLATGSEDGLVRIFETDSFSLLLELEGHGDAVLDAAWSPDGERLATASRDGTVRLWNSVRRELRVKMRVAGRGLRSQWSDEVRELLDQLSDVESVLEVLRYRTEGSPEERRAALRALRDQVGG